jgi:hypothetical protein
MLTAATRLAHEYEIAVHAMLRQHARTRAAIEVASLNGAVWAMDRRGGGASHR